MRRLISTSLLFALALCLCSAQGKGKKGKGNLANADIIKFETKVLEDNTDFKAVDLIKEQQELEEQLLELKNKKQEYLSARYPEYKTLLEKRDERRNKRANNNRRSGARKGNGKMNNSKMKLKR